MLNLNSRVFVYLFYKQMNSDGDDNVDGDAYKFYIYIDKTAYIGYVNCQCY